MCFAISMHLKYCLINRVAFGGRGLMRGMTFGGSDLWWEWPLVRVAFGGSDLWWEWPLVGVTFGGSGLWWEWPLVGVTFGGSGLWWE